MRKAVQNFQDLIVWQKAYAFVLKVYQTTKKFPNKEEIYGLTSQLREAAYSNSILTAVYLVLGLMCLLMTIFLKQIVLRDHKLFLTALLFRRQFSRSLRIPGTM